MPGQLIRGWLAILATGAIGFTITTLARSQLAGVGIALYFGETFARLFLPDVVKYLPFDVATASVATGTTGGGGFLSGGAGAVALPADVALVLVVAWLVGALFVAALATERAEITG